LSYLVTIRNVGNKAAANVAFADTPDGITSLVVGLVATDQGAVTKGNTAGDTSVGVNIGTIQPGGVVTISFRVQIQNTVNKRFVSNQGVVSSTGLPNVLTNDPLTLPANDPTVTPIPSCITAVTLQSFTATRAGDNVVVRWVTTAEDNTWGFYLLRSVDGHRDHATQVTPQLILGQGRGQGGANYTWTDTAAAPGPVYTYWLQEVELDGTINEYGPATTASAPAGRYLVFIPFVSH
jgi:uncharacterized repeat protein (TIGR01451 family)